MQVPDWSAKPFWQRAIYQESIIVGFSSINDVRNHSKITRRNFFDIKRPIVKTSPVFYWLSRFPCRKSAIVNGKGLAKLNRNTELIWMCIRDKSMTCIDCFCCHSSWSNWQTMIVDHCGGLSM